MFSNDRDCSLFFTYPLTHICFGLIKKTDGPIIELSLDVSKPSVSEEDTHVSV
jgi:hypothetical protein